VFQEIEIGDYTENLIARHKGMAKA